MRTWRVQPGERSELYSPIGLRLLDDLTGGLPIGRVDAFLDVLDGTVWRATGIQAIRTPGGVVAYPGLERRADVSGPPRHYRVRITADFYRPVYPDAPFNGFEFDAFPWNDTNPPQTVVASARNEKLTPAPGYPFPPFVPVLRGRVVDAAGVPLVDAEVRFVKPRRRVLSRVLADERGEFALSMQLAELGVSQTIEAVRGNRSRKISVTLPDDLGKSQTITI